MIALTSAHPPLVRVARVAARLTAAACAACWLAAAPVVGLAADRPPSGPARSRVSDPAVRPAGGGHCSSCGPGCHQPHGRHHGHHAGCRDGVCVPYCPVRPQQFGFYGTQWRRWPGSEVVQVAGTRDAGPVSPPRSAVPGPNEESLNPEADQEPAADAGAEAGRGAAPAATPLEPLPEPAVPPKPVAEPTAPNVLDPAPEMRREQPAQRPDSVPQPNLVPEPATAPKPESPLLPAEQQPLPSEPSAPVPEAKPRPEDENLFEAVSGVGSGPGWRAQRRFAVRAAAGPTNPGVGRIETATHLEEPTPASVPRVSFDPAAETRRLRSTR